MGATFGKCFKKFIVDELKHFKDVIIKSSIFTFRKDFKSNHQSIGLVFMADILTLQILACKNDNQ